MPGSLSHFLLGLHIPHSLHLLLEKCCLDQDNDASSFLRVEEALYVPSQCERGNGRNVMP